MLSMLPNVDTSWLDDFDSLGEGYIRAADYAGLSFKLRLEEEARRTAAEPKRPPVAIDSSTAPQHIARLIHLHCEANGIAVSRFGRDIANDPRIYADLKAGRCPREAKVAKIRAALSGAYEQ